MNVSVRLGWDVFFLTLPQPVLGEMIFGPRLLKTVLDAETYFLIYIIFENISVLKMTFVLKLVKLSCWNLNISENMQHFQK